MSWRKPKTVGSIFPTTVAGFIEPIKDGDYIFSVATFSAANYSLYIFDVSNPENPTVVSTTIIGSGAIALIKKNEYVYIVGDSWLKTVDVSSIVSPLVVNTLVTGNGQQIHSKDDYLYVVTTTSIKTISISTPNSPVLSTTTNIIPSVSANTLSIRCSVLIPSLDVIHLYGNDTIIPSSGNRIIMSIVNPLSLTLSSETSSTAFQNITDVKTNGLDLFLTKVGSPISTIYKRSITGSPTESISSNDSLPNRLFYRPIKVSNGVENIFCVFNQLSSIYPISIVRFSPRVNFGELNVIGTNVSNISDPSDIISGGVVIDGNYAYVMQNYATTTDNDGLIIVDIRSINQQPFIY